MSQISLKQEAFLKGRLARINLLEGSVRSGKTWISLVAFALFVASMPRSCHFLMVGKTLTTLKRNCLDLLCELEPTFRYTTSGKMAWLYGRQIWLEGADNERAENKIRGMTLAGVYIDELTLIPQGFYMMALGRMSVKGAKMIATTNPDSPAHWVHTDIIENDSIDKQVTKFLITENPYLDEEYIESLRTEYTGVFYQRFFLGEWVIAEGLVYDFGESNIVDEEPQTGEYYISCDYGTMNPFSAGLWCVNPNQAVRINEYYYNGRDSQKQKTDEEYCDAVCQLANGYNVRKVIVDPSAASFIAALQKRGFTVIKAKNDVIDGIRKTSSMLQCGQIKIHRRCKDCIREFGLYSWDKNSNTDAVVKENDHAMDDVRYMVNTVLKNKIGKQNYNSLYMMRGY